MDKHAKLISTFEVVNMVSTTMDLNVGLFPEIEPFHTEMLQVSKLHSIHISQYGNRNGKPLIFLHGGPGSGTNTLWLRMFDPRAYRIITFDQRGCGKSLPYACLEENTTWDLVEDIEVIRRHLGVERWRVVGGSWGCTLALAYAQKYSRPVISLVVWGVFLGSKQEISWCYQRGANAVFPDAWEEYLRPIPEAEHDDLVKAYHTRLTSPDKDTRVHAAKSWCIWDASVLRLIPDPQLVSNFTADDFAVAHASLECHYFFNRCFFNPDYQLIKDIDKIRQIPTTIIHARYDMMCPIEAAWKLHKAFPEAEFIIVPDAGHSAREPGNMAAIVTATNKHIAYS